MRIWIDGDACPAEIKGVLFRAAERTGTPLTLVANAWQTVPESDIITLELVPAGADVADDFIAGHCARGDLVITGDVPLAARIVEAGATGLDPRGEPFDAETIGERLAMRNFMEEMRSGGLVEGGPAAHSSGDTQRFANALDRMLTATGGC